jgi:hypothetical protein
MKTIRRFHRLTQIRILFIGAICGLFLCGCNKSPVVPPIQKWEYKIVEVENFEHRMEESAQSEISTNSEAGLQDIASARFDAGDFHLDQPPGKETDLEQFGLDIYALGQQGWELVSAIPQTETTHPVSHDDVIASVRTGKVILIFKRPAQ